MEEKKSKKKKDIKKKPLPTPYSTFYLKSYETDEELMEAYRQSDL